jgi:thiamine biosynthesis lipoprotein
MAEISTASECTFDPCYSGGATSAPALTLNEENQTVALAPGAALPDFGACAKGFAIDLAVETLRSIGVRSAFIHGGTSSGFGLGQPAERSGWPVALGPEPGDPVVLLRDEAFSVSDTRVRRDKEWVAHIRDPRTGLPIESDRSVAVIGPSAAAADAWSTAAAVAGRRPARLDQCRQVWIRHRSGPWALQEQEGQ